jgi:hypothetical protein
MSAVIASCCYFSLVSLSPFLKKESLISLSQPATTTTMIMMMDPPAGTIHDSMILGRLLNCLAKDCFP